MNYEPSTSPVDWNLCRCLFRRYLNLQQLHHRAHQSFVCSSSDFKEWPTPSSVTEVRSFHRLTSFYRRFIVHFSAIMAPLTDVMHHKSFVWTPEAVSTFAQIKLKLTSASILVLPNFSSPFELNCEAFCHPIAYFSEKVTGARLQYSTYDVEFCYVVRAARHWRHYLFQREFVLFTDHEALKHLATQDSKQSFTISEHS